MARLRINSVLYKFLTASFYMFCFAGLIFQEMKISVNYFKFKVVTNIKLIQPEEVEVEKYLDWCFEINELFNRTKFDMVHRGRNFEDLSMRELLSIALDPDEIFEHVHDDAKLHKLRKELVPMFIICYQIQMNHSGQVSALSDNYTQLVTFTSIALSGLIPDIDANRFTHHYLIRKESTSFLLTLMSYDYYIRKLKYPYVDNCFDYRDDNYFDKWGGVNHCHYKVSNGSILDKFNVYASDPRYLDSKVGIKNASIEDYCRKMFSRPDCERNTTYTR